MILWIILCGSFQIMWVLGQSFKGCAERVQWVRGLWPHGGLSLIIVQCGSLSYSHPHYCLGLAPGLAL